MDRARGWCDLNDVVMDKICGSRDPTDVVMDKFEVDVILMI